MAEVLRYARPGRSVAGTLSTLSLSLALGFAGPLHAASLGTINVLSSLGEPLQAEIEIFDLTSEEASDLDVALASEADFENAGSSRTALMESLTLRVIQQGRRHLVQIQSDKPLAEPVYGLRLELRANGESTVSEFAVLPEEMARPVGTVATAAPAAPVAETAQSAESASENTSAANTDTRTADTQPAAMESAVSSDTENVIEIAGKGAENLALADASSAAQQHTVQRGENLTVIARQHVADSQLDKFITAIYNGNPDAFIQNNLHYLKAGAVLALPSEESVSQVDEKAARKTIVTQWQSFKTLLPATDAQASKTDSAPATRTSNRKVSGANNASTPTAGDRLTLANLKPGSDAGADGKTGEDAIAARKAAEEASERIRLLEKNILDLKTTIQPAAAPSADPAADTSEKASDNSWGVVSSPTLSFMMQGATVLLLAALVVATLRRRNAK